MADQMEPQANPEERRITWQKSSEYTAPQKAILLTLGKAIIMREGEASKEYLHTMTLELSKENFDLVIQALESLGRLERADGESAVPSFGRVLREMRQIEGQSHPHRHLRGIVTRLARIYGLKADEEFLMLYQEEAGHRTDADLDKAYAAIRGDETLKKMPTPGAFRSACGVPKVYRDGTRPA